MFLVTSKEIEDYLPTFRWHTSEGEILTLDRMSSSHKFNCLKMLYNHIAKQYGLPTIWFTRQYEDYIVKAQTISRKLALQMCAFIISIETEGTLPQQYWESYQQILAVLQNLKIAKLESKLLIKPTSK